MNKSKIMTAALVAVMALSGCSLNESNHSGKNKKKNDSTIDNPYYVEMEDVVVSYYYGHHYMNMELVDTVKPTEIELDEDQIEELERAFKKIKEYKLPKNTDSAYPLTGFCKVCINEDLNIYCSNTEACAYIKEEDYYFTDEEFNDIVCGIVEDYEEQNLHDDIFCKPVATYYRNEESGSVDYDFDIENYPELKKIKCSTFECDLDPNEYGTITDVFLFEDGTLLMVYDGVGDGYYVNSTGNGTYITFDTIGSNDLSLGEYLAIRAQNVVSNTNSSQHESIIIRYDNSEYTINVEDELNELYEEFSCCAYMQFDYLDDVDFSNCVEVETEIGYFYIPTDTSDGNTYYVNNDGERYLAFINNDIRQNLLDRII